MDNLSVKELFPADPSVPRTIYCDICGKHMRLREAHFKKKVSGVCMTVNNIIELYCSDCDISFWPEDSRFALIRLWERARDAKQGSILSNRRKRDDDFGFTDVKFIYDPDDYYYLPGLARENSPGYLTPVFFHKRVLTKFDSLDDYSLKFGSRTYGGIYFGEHTISFGINENEKVVMWLGDIAELPESEQYYLRSENVVSDHSLGSAFYDGQIECLFTDGTSEDALIEERSEFLDAARQYFGRAISHLDEEVLKSIEGLIPPVLFSDKNVRFFCDLLNRICSESLDSVSLGELLKEREIEPKQLGTLKRLQKLLEHEWPEVDVATILCPFFVAYDLRVANSHLTSQDAADKKMSSCKQRLGVSDTVGFEEVYKTLVEQLVTCFRALRSLIASEEFEVLEDT